MLKRSPVFITAILVLLSMATRSQNYVFHLDSITNNDITFDSCWIYHPGDDTAWAAYDYPDLDWDTASTDLNMSYLNEDFFPGFGWFRLHMAVDSSLMDKTFILLIRHKGASEIYHNGFLLKRTGRLGVDTGDYRYLDPSNLPIPIHFNDQIHQVIAIRYANEDAMVNYKKYKWEEAGFTLSITDLPAATSALIGVSLGTNIVVALFLIFFILGGLHLLLFLFFRDNKSNLYYSIFALGFAMIVFSSYLELATIFRPGFTLAFAYYLDFLAPFLFIPLMALVYNLFYNKTPVIFWIIAPLAVIISVLKFLDVSWFIYALGGLILLIFVEIFRVVIRGMI